MFPNSIDGIANIFREKVSVSDYKISPDTSNTQIIF